MNTSDVCSAPLVSVCIANYNGAGVIEQCIESVLHQNHDVSIEILVHDDCSTDESVTILKKRFTNAVTLIESDSNVGYCVSNNRLAASASGKYLLFLNNDAFLADDALNSLANFAETHDDRAILSLPQHSATTRELIDIGCIFDPFLNAVPNLDPSRSRVAMVAGACLWVPRAMWNEIGGFPDWFSSMAEDMYLCCCAWLYGYSVRVITGSCYMHHVGTSFGGGKVIDNRLSTTYRRRYLSERNRSYLMVMLYPLPLLMLILPLHVVSLVVEGIVLSIKTASGAAWQKIYGPALLSLIRERKRLVQERRHLQKKRQRPISEMLGLFTVIPYKLRMLFKHGLPDVK